MSEEPILDEVVKLLKKKVDHPIILKYIDMRLKILLEVILYYLIIQYIPIWYYIY